MAHFSREQFIGFSQLSYGQGFVHSVKSTFPELERVASLESAMERALDFTFDSAYREVEQAAQGLRSSCHCKLCSGRSSSDADSETWGDCFLTLALTIRDLVSALSCTNHDDFLLVAVYGLEKYYKRNQSVYDAWSHENNNKKSFSDMAVGLATVPAAGHSSMIRVHGFETLLQHVRPLFDGSSSSSIDGESDTTVAVSRNGICCYRECLHGVSSEAGAMRTINVIPGHIERGMAQYDVVEDEQSETGLKNITEFVTLAPAETAIPKHQPIRLGKFEIKALARESSKYRCLHFCYKILLPDGCIVQIPPGLFSNNVLLRTGMLTCYGSMKCKQKLAFPCSAVKKGWVVPYSTPDLYYNSALALCLWSYSEDIARCVAFDLYSRVNLAARTTFLRRDECLPCCTEMVLRDTATILKYSGGSEGVVAHII